MDSSENSDVFHFFFDGETRDKANSQLVTLKDMGNQTVDIELIEKIFKSKLDILIFLICVISKIDLALGVNLE